MSVPAGAQIQTKKNKPEKLGDVEKLDAQEKLMMSRSLMQTLTKSKPEASTAVGAMKRADDTLKMLKEGDVAGKRGQFKAALAPWASLVGIDWKSLNDAQKYELISRSNIGAMRMELIGPGPVSEWEQKLLQQLSGGGGAVKEAAIALIDGYKALARKKIMDYNDTVKSASEFNPRLGQLFRPIELKEDQAPGAKPRIGAAGVRKGTLEDF